MPELSEDRRDVYGVTVTAFIGLDARIKLEPPRDYTSITGAPGRTRWILEFGYLGPEITLHVDDPTKLWELHDVLAATLPPREGGAPDA